MAPSLQDLPLELGQHILDLVKRQDESYQERIEEESSYTLSFPTNSDIAYGRGVTMLSMTSKAIRVMCMSTIFEHKFAKSTLHRLPTTISHSLDPRQYVKTVTLPESNTIVQFLPRLDVFPNLQNLTISNNWQHLDDLFPHISSEAKPNEKPNRPQSGVTSRPLIRRRRDRHRDTDSDDTTTDDDSSSEEDSESSDEGDDDSDMEEEEEYPSERRSLNKARSRQKSSAETIQSARKSLRTILPRLTSFCIGTARHIEQLIALFDLLDPSRIKTLAFGTSGKSSPRYQQETPQPEFITALDRFAHLEELAIGLRPCIGLEFSEHAFTFNKILKRLKVNCLGYGEDMAEFIGGFQSLERLELKFDEASVSERATPSTLSLPNLTFLSVITTITIDGELASGISQTLESFVSAPKLRNILIDFNVGSRDDYEDELGEFEVSDMAELLRPLCSTEIFPQLHKIDFDERAAKSLDGDITQAKPEQLVPTRLDLRIEFRPDKWEEDYEKIVSPYSVDRKLDDATCTESQARQFCLDESEALLEWGLREIANMRSDSRNRDKMGTTSEAHRLMDALKELGKIKRISED